MSDIPTWWTQRWIDSVVESRDFKTKVRKGRILAKRRRVSNIVIRPGLVTASVSTEDAGEFSVRLRQRPLDEETWDTIIERLSSEAHYATLLLDGQLSEEMNELFESEGGDLLPYDHHDLTYWCTCGDYSAMCVHSVALHFAIAEAIGNDPFVLLEFRGKSREALMKALRSARDLATPADEDVAEAEAVDHEPVDSLKKRFWKTPGLPRMAFTLRSGDARQGEVLPVVRALGKAPFETPAETVAEVLSLIIDVGLERLLKRVDSLDDAHQDTEDEGPRERVDDMLVAAARQHGALTTSLVASALGLSNTEARRHLQWLVQEGRLEVVGRARGTKYVPISRSDEDVSKAN